MKAVVLVENNRIALENLPRPKLKKAGDVLVRVAYTGICGSDYVRFFEHQAKRYPIILGHECSGVVEESLSHDYKEGEQVAIIPLKPNFEDEQSQKGNYSLSDDYGFIGSREDGGLQEYLIVAEENLVHIPREVDLKTAAFIEPITVVLHGFKVVQLKKLDVRKIALLGMGTIGLLALQVLTNYGYEVTSFDISEEKLALAQKLGARTTIDVRDQDALKEVFGQFDLVVETSGATPSFYLCHQLATKKGDILYIGTPHTDLTFTFQTFELINRKELTIKGSWMNYSAPWPGEEWQEAISLFREGAIQVGPLIGREIQLENFQASFDDYRNRIIDGKLFVDVKGDRR